jgi:hypothetical protein
LTATERARPLLQPDHRDAPQQDGVIDLIADDEFAPAGARSGACSPTSSRPSTLPFRDRSFDAVCCFATIPCSPTRSARSITFLLPVPLRTSGRITPVRAAGLDGGQ